MDLFEHQYIYSPMSPSSNKDFCFANLVWKLSFLATNPLPHFHNKRDENSLKAENKGGGERRRYLKFN